MFACLFEAHFESVLAYARRRTAQLPDAEDLVAETFTVAWRRLDRLPDRPEEQLPWLYGIARRLLANQRRGAARRMRLLERLQFSFRAPTVSSTPDIVAAVVALPERDQEILRLIAWESLTYAEAGAVLGISANAVAIRVHRARERLRRVKASRSGRTFPGWKGSANPAEQGDELT